MFSICLCTWNDLPYLKILYRGLQKNTRIPYELVVHDNGSTDGTEEWLCREGIGYTRSTQNEGVAAVNHAVANAKFDFIVDINADMYPLPGWDMAVLSQMEQFQKQDIEQYTISATLIEPVGNNPTCVIRDFGTQADEFKEENLLQDYATRRSTYEMPFITQFSHPIMMPKRLWDSFSGVDSTYFPGYTSDYDIASSAYKIGCRHFVRLGNCHMYHFVSKTLEKLSPEVRNRHGWDIFYRKWGMSPHEFQNRLGAFQPFTRAPDGIL